MPPKTTGNALTTIDTGPIAASVVQVADPMQYLLADKRSENTRRAYAADLRDFFNGEPKPADVMAFVSLDVAEVAIRLNQYKGELLRAGLAEATVNRRLAAVKSLLKMAYRLGHAKTTGAGLVDCEKVRAYRNTKGIPRAAMTRLLAAPDASTLKGKRDRAILRLLCENALRRDEVCNLNVSHLNTANNTLSIRGKGRGSQREEVELSARTVEAITAYLDAAGHAEDAHGPLFRNVSHRPDHCGARLTGDGIHHVIREYGAMIGADGLAPHKLRHSAITAYLEASSGDVRGAQQLSRHANLQTLMIYDDGRQGLQGKATRLLSELL